MAGFPTASNGTRLDTSVNSSASALNSSAGSSGDAGTSGFFQPRAGRIQPGSQALIVVLALFIPIILFGVLFALIRRRRRRPIVADDILGEAGGFQKQPGFSAATHGSKQQRARTSWAEMFFGRWSYKEEDSGALMKHRHSKEHPWDAPHKLPDEEEPEWEYPKVIRPTSGRSIGIDAATSNGNWSSSEDTSTPVSCSPSSNTQKWTLRTSIRTSEPSLRAVAATAEAGSNRQSQIPSSYPAPTQHSNSPGPQPLHSHGTTNSSRTAAAAGVSAAGGGGGRGVVTGRSSSSSSSSRRDLPDLPASAQSRLLCPPAGSYTAANTAKQQLHEIQPGGLSDIESWHSCCSVYTRDLQHYHDNAAAPVESGPGGGVGAGMNGNQHQLAAAKQCPGPDPKAAAGAAAGGGAAAAAGGGAAAAAAGGSKAGTGQGSHLHGDGVKRSGSSNSRSSNGTAVAAAAAAGSGAANQGVAVKDVQPLSTPFAAAASQPFERKNSYRSSTSWWSRPGA